MAVNEDLLLFLHYFLSILKTFKEEYRPFYVMELDGLLWGTSHFSKTHDPGNITQLSSGQLYFLLDLLKTQKAFDSLPCKISFTARGLLDIKENLVWSEKILERRPEKQKVLQERHKNLLENIREGTMDLTYKELYGLSYVVSDARSRRGQQIEEIPNETKREDSRSAFLFCGFPVDLLLFENQKTLSPFFRSYLDSYLEAFRNGRVHWRQNVLTWNQQEKHVMDVLRPLQERFGEQLFISREDFLGVDGQWIEGFKPVETLLALSLDRIGISSVRMNDKGTLDLCILMKPKQALVQISPLPASEQRKRELLTVYDDVLKKFDLKSFKEKYVENPVAMATMHRVMSPEFLRIAGEITREQKHWKEQYGKAYEEEIQRLKASSGFQTKEFQEMQEQMQEASEEMQSMFIAHKPDLERLQEYSAKTAKDLTRDLETIDKVTKELNEPFAVATSALQSLQTSEVLTALDTAMVDNRQSLVLPLPTISQERRLRSGEMIVTTEDYIKLSQENRARQQPLENLSKDAIPTMPPKKTLGRPPKIQYLRGNICDGNKTSIIHEKMTVLVALCSTILRLTDDKDRGRWRIEHDVLYEAHQQKPDGTWMELGEIEQEKFKKLLRNHIPRINGFFEAKGHSEWLGRDAVSVTRQY